MQPAMPLPVTFLVAIKQPRRLCCVAVFVEQAAPINLVYRDAHKQVWTDRACSAGAKLISWKPSQQVVIVVVVCGFVVVCYIDFWCVAVRLLAPYDGQ